MVDHTIPNAKAALARSSSQGGPPSSRIASGPPGRASVLSAWLLRLAGLAAGASVLGFVLLALDSAPVEAAPSVASQDPRPPDVISDVVAPVARPLGVDLSISDVDMLAPAKSPENPGLGQSLNGVGPVPDGATRVEHVVHGAAQPVLGTLASGPRAVFEATDTTVRPVLGLSGGPRSVAGLPEPGAIEDPGLPGAEPLSAPGTVPGLRSGDAAGPPDLVAVPEDGSGPGGTSGALGRSLHDAGSLPSVSLANTSSRQAPPPGTVTPVAPVGRSAMPSGAVAAAGSLGDGSGASHPFAVTLPAAAVLVALPLFFLAAQPRRALCAPVSLPLVRPD